MESMALADYLEQVKRYLPPWKAEEILREIRSHVLDQAESVAAERGVAPDDAVVRDVLATLGPPEKLAAGYLEPVVLIRSEYTTHFLFYSAILVLFHAAVAVMGTIFGGMELGEQMSAFLGNALLDFGIVFVFLAILSRFDRVVHLPLWFPGLGTWKENWARRGRRVFEHRWVRAASRGASPARGASSPNSAAAAPGAGSPVAAVIGPGVPAEAGRAAAAPAAAERADSAPGGTEAAAPPFAEGSPPPVPRSAPLRPKPRFASWEWFIERSGPRRLRFGEMLGAGLAIAFAVVLATYLGIAPSPLPLVAVPVEDARRPDESFVVQTFAPGVEPLRELAVAACVATAAAGLLSLVFGMGWSHLLASVVSRSVWTIFFVLLLFSRPLVEIRFASADPGVLADGIEASRIAHQVAPLVVLGILLLFTLGLAGRLVRLGMYSAWYHRRGAGSIGPP
jgi:hypothetical protein